MFKKAGQPVWGAFVPIVQIYFLLKTVGRPGWWLVFMLFCPIVNIIMGIIVIYDLARSFGHGIGMTLGLIFLPFIFLYVIGYGSSSYQGPAVLQGGGGGGYSPPPAPVG